MKLIHISDLHLGKRVNGFSMLEDQQYILREILDIISEERPDGILIAGDVYDKSIPPVEAIGLFNDFLQEIAMQHIEAFIISGNHDSAERLSFASQLIDASGIHISPAYRQNSRPFRLSDEWGDVYIYMLPFIKPSSIRHLYGDEQIASFTDAVKLAVSNMNIDEGSRNIIVSHQFITGAHASESEEISVGGLENVNADVYMPFDYAALGHIHKPQAIGSEKIRYCGSPLKYSFSEMDQEKSVTIVRLREKGNISIDTRSLLPLRQMRQLKGTYEELSSRNYYENITQDDYLKIVLTDEEDILYAMDKLRMIYPNIMQLEYDNARTKSLLQSAFAPVRQASPIEMLKSFYALQNGKPMNNSQIEFSLKIFEEEGL